MNTQGADSLAVFWNEQAHEESFDGAGHLIAPLPVHWKGDRTQIGSALQAAALVVVEPDDDDTTFSVEPRDYQPPQSGRKLSDLF